MTKNHTTLHFHKLKEPHFVKDIGKAVKKNISVHNIENKITKPFIHTLIAKIIKPAEHTLTHTIEPTLKSQLHSVAHTLEKDINKPMANVFNGKDLKTINSFVKKNIESKIEKDIHTLQKFEKIAVNDIKKEDKLINKAIVKEEHKINHEITHTLSHLKQPEHHKEIAPVKEPNSISQSENPIIEENKPFKFILPFKI